MRALGLYARIATDTCKQLNGANKIALVVKLLSIRVAKELEGLLESGHGYGSILSPWS